MLCPVSLKSPPRPFSPQGGRKDIIQRSCPASAFWLSRRSGSSKHPLYITRRRSKLLQKSEYILQLVLLQILLDLECALGSVVLNPCIGSRFEALVCGVLATTRITRRKSQAVSRPIGVGILGAPGVCCCFVWGVRGLSPRNRRYESTTCTSGSRTTSESSLVSTR